MSRDDLLAERATLLAALRGLEEERAAGDLAEDDYESLREGYTARAAAVLRALGSATGAPGSGRAGPGDATSGADGPRHAGPDGARSEAADPPEAGAGDATSEAVAPNGAVPRQAGPGEAGHDEVDSHEADSHEADSREADSHDADSHEADSHEAGDGIVAGPAEGFPDRRARRWRTRRLVAVVVVAAMAVGGGLGVTWVVADRRPGDTVSGSLPTTVEGMLDRAHEFEAQRQPLDALKTYDAVLAQDPANLEALTYRGWLLRLAGLPDEADAALSQAVSLDAAYPDARFFRGVLRLRDRQDPSAALEDFEVFLGSDPPPELAEAVRRLADEARGQLAGGGGGEGDAPPPG